MPRPYLLLTLAALIWSSNFVLGRYVSGAIPPLALSFWRWALALVLLLPFAWSELRGRGALLLRHWKSLLALGVLGIANFNTFTYLGLQSTTATNAVLMVSTTPVVIVLLSFVLLGQRVRAPQALGIAVSLAGVAVIVAQGEPARLAALTLNRGDAWVLAAVLSWAAYSVCLRWRPAGLPPLAFLVATMAAGLVVLAPLYAWGLAQGHRFEPTPLNLGAIAYGRGVRLTDRLHRLEPCGGRGRCQPRRPLPAPDAGLRHRAVNGGARRTPQRLPFRRYRADRARAVPDHRTPLARREVQRQPHRRLRRAGPLDAVAAVRRDPNPVARRQCQRRLAIEAQHGAPRQQDHPLVAVLVEPLPFRRRLTVRDDALEAQPRALEQRLETLGFEPYRDAFEKIAAHGCHLRG